MSQCCDICGIAALEGQEFAQERLPFRRARRYCPACHKKFYLRVYAVLAIIPIVFAIFGVWEILRAHKRMLDSVGIWYALLVLIQWVMIVPHELGHAVVARLLGYTQIRILVGAGKPLLSFRFLGFSWLLNLIPFGGLTLFKLNDQPSRWKYFAVIAAGPAVNIAAAGAACFFAPPGSPFDHPRTVAKLFFWANVIVLAENLIPQVFQTPYGPTGSDGLKLWTILFRWNKVPSAEPTPVPL